MAFRNRPPSFLEFLPSVHHSKEDDSKRKRLFPTQATYSMAFVPSKVFPQVNRGEGEVPRIVFPKAMTLDSWFHTQTGAHSCWCDTEVRTVVSSSSFSAPSSTSLLSISATAVSIIPETSKSLQHDRMASQRWLRDRDHCPLSLLLLVIIHCRSHRWKIEIVRVIFRIQSGREIKVNACSVDCRLLFMQQKKCLTSIHWVQAWWS